MKKLLFFSLFFFSIIFNSLYADDVTILTYYPAPYGVYRRLAVGQNVTAPVGRTLVNIGGTDDMVGTGCLLNIGMSPGAENSAISTFQQGTDSAPSFSVYAQISNTSKTAEDVSAIYGKAHNKAYVTSPISITGIRGESLHDGDTRANVFGGDFSATSQGTGKVTGVTISASCSGATTGYAAYGVESVARISNLANDSSLFGSSFSATSLGDGAVWGQNISATSSGTNFLYGIDVNTTSRATASSAGTYGMRSQAQIGDASNFTNSGPLYGSSFSATSFGIGDVWGQSLTATKERGTGTVRGLEVTSRATSIVDGTPVIGITSRANSAGPGVVTGLDIVASSTLSTSVSSVKGLSVSAGSSGNSNVYGVYSTASGPSGFTWAGYFIGDVRVVGTIEAGTSFRDTLGKNNTVNAFDIAELFICSKDVEHCDVVVINTEENGELIKCSAENQSAAGIISDDPKFKFGNRELILKESPEKNPQYLALAGQVMCKVDASYGEIKRGDLLAASPTPGHAMKAKPIGELNGHPIYPQGCIVGKALEPLKEGKGKILVLVCLM